MPTDGPGIVDFQLYLLQTMDAPQDLLHGALDLLGADTAAMADRAARVSPLLRPRPGMAQELKAFLAGARASDVIGDADSARYSFPVWPELQFLVKYDPSGFALARAGFVRMRQDSGAPRSVPTPWEFVKTDLETGFDDITEVDAWGHYETCTATDVTTRKRCFLRFGWALLQESAPG